MLRLLYYGMRQSTGRADSTMTGARQSKGLRLRKLRCKHYRIENEYHLSRAVSLLMRIQVIHGRHAVNE